jgi:hypothetical protein
MPVYRLSEEMPYEELTYWMAFFQRRPVGWMEDMRIMKILEAMGIKAKPEEVFQSLALLRKNSTPKRIQGLRSSFLFKCMLEATGGDQPEFLKEIASD